MIRQRIRKYWVIAIICVAALCAAFVVGCIQRWMLWTMAFGGLVFVGACFFWSAMLYPNIRYRQFMKDMNKGLGREICGSILEISDKEENQDGVRVFPVRVQLEQCDDERIVYLNVTKADLFPKTGTRVKLSCFGRHVRAVEVV